MRHYLVGSPQKQETRYFLMEIFHNGTFLESQPMELGDNADIVNQTKSDISKKYGYQPTETYYHSKPIFKDENGMLYYFKWYNHIGNVKTFVN
jgi:hypothetical protein